MMVSLREDPGEALGCRLPPVSVPRPAVCFTLYSPEPGTALSTGQAELGGDLPEEWGTFPEACLTTQQAGAGLPLRPESSVLPSILAVTSMTRHCPFGRTGLWLSHV